MVLIDILDPIGKPSNRVVVDDLFPRSRGVGLRNRLMLTDVNRDIFRTNAFLGTETSDEWSARNKMRKDLEGAFLGMFASTSE